MKVRILKATFYSGMDNVELPIEVNAQRFDRPGGGHYYRVLGRHLLAHGAAKHAFTADTGYSFPQDEVEEV